MNRTTHQLCVLFGLAVLFALLVTAASAGSPKKRGVAGGIRQMDETLGLSFDYIGGSQTNEFPPYGWGTEGTPPGKAFESAFAPAGQTDGGVSGGIDAPEPATMMLVGSGLLALAILARRKLKK